MESSSAPFSALFRVLGGRRWIVALILSPAVAAGQPAFPQQPEDNRESSPKKADARLQTGSQPSRNPSAPQTQPVAEEPSLASLFDWTLRFTLDLSSIQDLPLRGFRTFDQLALLATGVFPVPFSSGRGPAVGIGVGQAGQFSVNGFRGRSNNFTIDGSDNNDEDIGMRRQGFVALVPQTIESIQDFQVQTAGSLSEFGRNAGSMVNAVSRSGTLDHHGSFYGSFSDDALKARGFFDRDFSDRKNQGNLGGGSYSGPDFDHQIYSGTLGGPILPKRVFYFLSAEHQRFGGSRLGHFVVPSDGRDGAPNERGLRINPRFSSPSGIAGFVPIEELGEFFSDRFVPINYSDAAGLGVFGLYPLPNNSGGPFGPHTYSQVRPDEGNGTILSAKLDWAPADAHTFTGRYNFTQDETLLPFTGEAINSSVATDTRTQNLSLFLNSFRGGTANLLRFSYGRTRLGFPPEKGSPLLFGSVPCSDCPEPFALVINTPYGSFGPFGATGPVGQLTIAPYSTLGVDVFNFPQGRVDNTFQVGDNLTWTTSTHTLQAGFDIRFSQLNSFADRNSRPAYFFSNGFVDPLDCGRDPFCLFNTGDGLLRGTDLAALGAPGGAFQSLSTGSVPDTTLGLRIAHYELFVQDSWRIRPNLTLNLGLRYDLQPAPGEQNRRIEETFGLSPDQFGRIDSEGFEDSNEAFDAALLALQGFLAGRETIFDSDKDNFAPRLGLAWDPFGDGRTVVRAGFGIYYNAILGAVTSQSRNVFPTFVPVNLDPSFLPPTGGFLNGLPFLEFSPNGARLVKEGTLNTCNLCGDAFATAIGTLFRQTSFLDGLFRSANGLAFTLPEKNLKTSYGRHFVLSVERQFGNLLGSLSYVGTEGVHLTRFATPNGGFVSTPSLLFPFPFGTPNLTILSQAPRIGSGTTRPEPDLGAFTVFENSASSNYHSLQASLEKRLGGSIRFRAGWTWSHAIDDVSDPFTGRGFFALPQDTTRPSLERASANFDVRHRFSGFFRWELPSWRRSPFFQNWRLSAIGEFQTGQPFTVNTSWDLNGDGNLTDRLLAEAPVRVDDQGDFSVSGNLGRNTLRSDGIANLDLALARRFELSPAASIDFRLEVFNVIDHTALGIPIRILESPGFGRPYDTQTDARSIRLALRLAF